MDIGTGSADRERVQTEGSVAVSRRTLQRRARAAGKPRFAWNEIRDADLRALWLDGDVALLCELIGCKPRTLYDRADALGLPPRDPTARAIAGGAAPKKPMALPSADELLRSLRPFAAPASGLPGGFCGSPRNLEDA